MLSRRQPRLQKVLSHTLCLLVALPCLTSAVLYAGQYEKAFDELRSPDGMVEAERQGEVISTTFASGSPPAVAFVMGKLWSQPSSSLFQDRQAAETDALVARTILAALPGAVQEGLLAGIPEDPYKKARLIEAAGGFKTPKAAHVIAQSLEDTRSSGLPLGTEEAWPLRVCDVAYNTLVHRLRLTELRSPLGTAFAYSSRDRWIHRLQEWLAENQDKMGN